MPTTAPRAVTINTPGDLRVVPAEPRDPGPGEALVRVAFSGICGSDRELFVGGRPKDLVRYPVVPGHEWSGTVAEVGTGVDPGLVGKPVVGEGFRSCQVCSACRGGDTNLCSAAYEETGFTQPGAWADYLTLPARLLHVLHAGADLRAAAVLEPAACVAAASLKLDTQPGEKVAVVGGGSLGLLATQLLAAASPAELVLVHPRRDRGDLATDCGAHMLITPDEAQQRFGTFDAVFEAAGATGTANLSARLVRPGGRIVLTGVPANDTRPPSPTYLVCAQITVYTVFGAPAHAWTHIVRAFANGILHPELIISGEMEIDDAAEALSVLTEQRVTTVKLLLHP